jgi:CubicO group peptidase (beta-lactamase class C family)
MKTCLKHLHKILLLVAIFMMFPSIAFAENDIYTDVKKSAVELAEVLVNDYKVSGVQYALISDGKIVVSGTSGIFHKANIKTLDNKSIFGIGSISKMFPATAIMLLSDQGKLNLDEPVATYLPEFKMADERYKEITVRMLLNHSSGIMGSLYVNSGMYDYPTTLNHDNFLKELAKQKLKGDPGEFSVYCNDGFTLAELVVEKVSGMSFSEFIKKNITEPLGMTNTKTPQDDFDRNRLARTFINEKETPIETLNMIGAGGVYSTAEDLCRLGQAYMNDPGYAAAAKLLSQYAKTKTMQKEYLRSIGPEQNEGLFGYGLGWDSVDAYPYSQYHIQALVKGGDTGLYHGSMIVLPEYNMAFAAVLSGGSSFYGQVMGQTLLLKTLLAENDITEIIPPRDLQAPVLSSMPLEQTSYAGIYANNAMVMNVSVGTEGKITISALSHKDIPDEIYLYASEGVFVNEDGSKKLTFVNESNGKTYIQIKQFFNLPNMGQTVMTSYEYEKIEPNIIDDVSQKAWDERNGTKYYIVNEIPQSQAYHKLESSHFEITTNKELPGYAVQYKIVDSDTAWQDVQIPVMAGRDLGTLEISNIDGKEYLSNAGSIFISEKDMVDMYAGDNAICTIQENGYARWYTISQNDAGKTMTVNLPENASFAVYDEESCVYYSTVNANQAVKLPENGKVVYIGEAPGDCFTITTK